MWYSTIFMTFFFLASVDQDGPMLNYQLRSVERCPNTLVAFSSNTPLRITTQPFLATITAECSGGNTVYLKDPDDSHCELIICQAVAVDLKP
jgi:hypothetical protein